MTKSTKSKKGIKVPVLLEILLFSIILVGMNLIFFPDDLGFHKLIFNPFWLLILLVVVRYGLKWGYFIVFLAAIYTLLTPPYDTETILARLPQIAVFFALILLFGPIQARYSRRIKGLEDSLSILRKDFKNLKEIYEVTDFLKESYERKILIQTPTMSDIYQDALSIQKMDMDKLCESILKILHKYVGAEKSSVYFLDDNTLILKAYCGYTGEDEKPPTYFPALNKPFKAVVEMKEIFSISERMVKSQKTGNLPIFSGPLVNEKNEVIGILNVDSLDMLKFNRVSRKVFKLICGWASKALENLKTTRQADEVSIFNPRTTNFRYSYMSKRLEEAIISSNISKANYSFILIQVINWGKVREEKKEPALRFLSSVIRRCISETDIVGHFEHPNEIAVLLSQRNDNQLRVFISTLEMHLKQIEEDFTLNFKIGCCSNLSKKDSSSVIIAEARGELY